MLGDICIICSGSGETLHWDDIKEQTTVERCFSCRGRGIENTPHHDNRITNDTQLGLEEAVKAVNRFIGGHK